MPARRRQLSFSDLDAPLSERTLVVVDLETTGTSAEHDAITEIGAVKVRGGEVLGEFQTFVDPERPIPAYIAALTGITDATVAGAPRIRTALSMFLEFVGDAALVAHNARFDVGFLRARAADCDLPWPSPPVVDTLALARVVYRRDEVRDHRLGTLAAYVGACVRPDHRALSDARATVDLLHALIGRLGAGASTLEDLMTAHRRARPVQLRKRHLADGIPAAPGVYRFVDAQGSVLYVGTSGNLRSRVRTYFTAAETRRRVLDMLPRADRIDVTVCRTATEAAVRELRAIAAERPEANRAGLRPEKALWLRLGAGREGLSAARIARDESDGSAQIGPLASRHDVEPLRGLLTDAVLGPGARFERERSVGAVSAGHHERLRHLMVEDPTPLIDDAAARMRHHVDAGRYEDADRVRQVAAAFLTAARRAARLRALCAVPLLVAARPSTDPVIGGHGWEMIAVRHGRLLGADLLPWSADVLAEADRLAAADPVLARADPAPLGQGHHQESEILLRWLDGEEVRIVRSVGTWTMPATGRFDPELLAEQFRRTSATGCRST